MSLTFKINPSTNDMIIKNGKLTRVTGSDEVVQRVRTTLRHFWGEYWLNLDGGVPWYELILSSKDVRFAEAVIRKTILSVPGVASIVQFSTGFQKGRLDINAQLEVETNTGTTVVGFSE